jgi:hypothetical protein
LLPVIGETQSAQELQTGNPFSQDSSLTLTHFDFSAISIGDDQHVPAAQIGANLFDTLQIYKCRAVGTK